MGAYQRSRTSPTKLHQMWWGGQPHLVRRSKITATEPHQPHQVVGLSVLVGCGPARGAAPAPPNGGGGTPHLVEAALHVWVEPLTGLQGKLRATQQPAERHRQGGRPVRALGVSASALGAQVASRSTIARRQTGGEGRGTDSVTGLTSTSPPLPKRAPHDKHLRAARRPSFSVSVLKCIIFYM